MDKSHALIALGLTLASSQVFGQGDQQRQFDPKPDLPDLCVRFIERTPRYTGTQVEYRKIDEPDGNKGDGLPVKLLNPKDQKWPKAGETVTFSAHLRNAGTRPTPAYDWHWVIDGADVAGKDGSGWDEPLQPGEERVYEIKWKWQAGRHFVAFETNRQRKFPEITHKNNAVVDPTDALSFHFFVQPGLYHWFESRKNGFDSYNWDDWAKFQVAEMNRTFRDEIHPATPNGIDIRVRLDKITMLPADFKDTGGMHVPDGMNNTTSGWDGLWGFLDGYLEKDASGKNVYERLPHWVTGVEWSLLHELGHQLGQPDYYLLPVSKERNEAVLGVAFDPPKWFRDQMMFSGNYAHDDAIGKGQGVWDSGYRFWGEHAARAFNRDGNTRRGFFGTFLIDLPKQTRFVFVDETMERISGAKVALHAAVSREYGNGRFRPKADREGVTDSSGGWTIQGSPWSVQLNWTSNGALQFVLETPSGAKRVGFATVTDLNLEYWRGRKDLGTVVVVTKPIGRGEESHR